MLAQRGSDAHILVTIRMFFGLFTSYDNRAMASPFLLPPKNYLIHFINMPKDNFSMYQNNIYMFRSFHRFPQATWHTNFAKQYLRRINEYNYEVKSIVKGGKSDANSSQTDFSLLPIATEIIIYHSSGKSATQITKSVNNCLNLLLMLPMET